MTTEDDFHRRLDECPEDAHTRLVFADWLEEHGDPRADPVRRALVDWETVARQIYRERNPSPGRR